MKTTNAIALAALIATLNVASAGTAPKPSQASPARVAFTEGGNVEAFWKEYADSKGGLTWGASSTYSEYDQVKEGDTLLINAAQGPCLMEFFHSRWRRANDVWRWSDTMNEYGGCPHVFE